MNLEREVLQWAYERGLLFPENSKNQLLKTFEEIGELSKALLENNKEKIKDGIGDVLITLIIFANNNSLSLQECLDCSYNEIKDRQGKTINGTFIKN